eukprot:s6033_g4.t1
MAPKLQKKPNAYVPKKGKFRKAFKRPASVKSKEYNAVKYVRVPTPPAPRHRGEQAKWRRSLKDLLCATNKSIVDMLTKDKILPNWQGMQCPRCQKGTLSGLIDCPGGGSLKKYRCGYKKCQHYLNPHHLHPLFQECRGPQGHTLQVQAAVLLLKLAEVKNDKIHKLLDVNHKAVEDMDKRLSEVRRTWVEQKQKTMKVGDGTSWVDVEGAVRKVEWKPLADKHLKGRAVVFHTDSAKSFQLRVQGIVHDNVVHAKKRVKINGKFVWKAPTYMSRFSLDSWPHDTIPEGEITWTAADWGGMDDRWLLCGYDFTVNSGSCSLSVDGCVHSPNFPNQYDTKACEPCIVGLVFPAFQEITPRPGMEVKSISFQTEQNWDRLRLNGVVYSGSSGPQGIIATGEPIHWQPDQVGQAAGWELCASSVFSVLQGNCTVEANCVESPQHSDEGCIIAASGRIPVRSAHFDLEVGSEFLSIGYEFFWGNQGPFDDYVEGPESEKGR